MKIKFTESRKGYHVADTDADVYLGQVAPYLDSPSHGTPLNCAVAVDYMSTT